MANPIDGGGEKELYNNHTDVTLQIIRTMSKVVINAQLQSEDGVCKHHVMHNGGDFASSK